jgi:hypothetical protein
VRTENYEGGIFDPPPDFAKLAEAANCYGETVKEPEEVGPALKRGLEQVRKGTPALVAAYFAFLFARLASPLKDRLVALTACYPGWSPLTVERGREDADFRLAWQRFAEGNPCLFRRRLRS